MRGDGEKGKRTVERCNNMCNIKFAHVCVFARPAIVSVTAK